MASSILCTNTTVQNTVHIYQPKMSLTYFAVTSVISVNVINVVLVTSWITWHGLWLSWFGIGFKSGFTWSMRISLLIGRSFGAWNKTWLMMRHLQVIPTVARNNWNAIKPREGQNSKVVRLGGPCVRLNSVKSSVPMENSLSMVGSVDVKVWIT